LGQAKILFSNAIDSIYNLVDERGIKVRNATMACMPGLVETLDFIKNVNKDSLTPL
jgi:hypothetical protein